MSTFHGDCTGPVGAHIYHGTCPHTWVSQFTGNQHTCTCECHGIEETD
jgi:hypothetical protein